MSTVNNDALEEALRWAALGGKLLPVGIDKRPIIKGFTERTGGNASSDPAQIRAWSRGETPWGRCTGFALLCGLASGFVVIDVDAQHGGSFGGLDLPPTLTHRTPQGGTHHFYRIDSEVRSIDKFAPGVELKGMGKYAVLAGSKSKNGTYSVVEPAAKIAAFPMDRARKPKPVQEERPDGAESRHDKMLRFARGLAKDGLGVAEMVDALSVYNETFCHKENADAELRGIADWAFDNGPMLNVGDSETWAPQDLDAVIAGIESGKITRPKPTILRRSDGLALIYTGRIQSFSGEPESGKGWLALEAMADVLLRGELGLYIDLEDEPVSIVGRLLALGIPGHVIRERFVYVRPDEPLSNEYLDALLRERYALVVIDGMVPAYNLLGLDFNSNDDIYEFINRLPRPFAKRGAAVVLIDHVTKDREGRGRWAIGGMYKLGGIDAAYVVEAKPTPTRERIGKLHITIAKDRPSGVGPRFEVIAIAYIVPERDGASVDIVLNRPEGEEAVGGKKKEKQIPHSMLTDLWNVIAAQPGIGQDNARRSVRGGNNEDKLTAIRLLMNQGHVTTPGRGLYVNPDKPYGKLKLVATETDNERHPVVPNVPTP